jgi:ubiquinone/menaquinone biosynthesis C-methylase UbiE
LLAVLPFTFHRLVSPRLPGFISTLPFPLAAAAIQFWSLSWLPTDAFMFLADDGAANLPLLHVAKGLGGGPILLFVAADIFLFSWFASVVVWMWNHEFRVSKIAAGASVFAAIFLAAIGYGCYSQISGAALPENLPAGVIFAGVWICPAGVLLLSIWALANRGKRKAWADRQQTVAQLQSPFTGNPLHVVSEGRREVLVSSSGERFPVRNGIPTFLKPEDLTGDNGKYNRLYETIGGFYDDTQRFFGAFRGLALDSYFENYMSLLEVKPGDSVLETTVGTGLNYKYLPRGVQLSGLDLSQEMLSNCQNNLRRWQMEADLYLGNAESLPFADSSFDAVFTAGGFNFFSDRAKAIGEMIRVAKPGGHLMIEDETEEYVKSTYEKIPFTSSFYSDRKQTVTVPIDMVPPEMEDIHLEMLKEGKFYAITFRKPAAGK